MQGLIEFPNSPALYPTYCEVASGKFSPLIKREEASDTIVSCQNPLGQNIITCKHPYRDEFVQEVNGLALNSKLKTQIEDLPFYIPILDLGSSNLGNIPPFLPVVGITLSDIVSQGILYKAGRYHEQNAIHFRSDILSRESFKNKKVILFNTGTDTLIEWLWYKRHESKLFETIRDMGFWAAGGINFSVIGGECAFAQALNQKRSLFSASLIEQNDILAIPHVYAITPYHIDRWVEWFIANPSIKLFTINCQLQKSINDIAQIITTIKVILRKLPFLHVLLQGFPIDNVNQFGSFIERIHLTDKIAVKFAQMRREILTRPSTGKLYNIQGSKKGLPELITNNINNRYFFLEALRSKILQRDFVKS